MKREISHQGRRHVLELSRRDEQGEVRLDGNALGFEIVARDGDDWTLRLDGRLVHGSVRVGRESVEIVHEGTRHVLDRIEEGAAEVEPEGLGPIEAPMTGRVVSVKVAEGAVVEAGAPLVIVEAMKMEHRLEAPQACRVAEVCCEDGQQVEIGELLVRLEELEEAP